MLRALGVAADFAFAISLGEFGATVFIARDWPTAPVAISGSSAGRAPSTREQAAALAVVLMALTAAAVLLVDRIAVRRDAVSALRIEELAVAFDGVPALARVELDLADGERLAVLGPSGSGKSTLLRDRGPATADAGRVLLDGGTSPAFLRTGEASG